MFQLKGPKILIILFSVTTVLQLSESQCTRGTYYYKDNGSSNCTKCPKNTFMDVNNHTHTECKRCRTTKEPHEPHVEVRRECNVTHDLFLNCSQNHFVQVEDKGLNRVECFECQVCSNGKQFEILPCNGINDTFCCASVDMIAEPNKDGIYECASRPSTTSSTTTTPTTAASNTSRKDVSTSDVSNQTTDVVTSPASSGQTDLPEASSTNLTCPRNYYLDVTQQTCSRCPACSFLDQEGHTQTACDHCSQRQPDNRLVYCPKRCDDEAPGALPTWARFIVGALVMVAAPFMFIMTPLLLNKVLNS